MSDCDRFAPRLADLLVGALEPADGQETLAHVEGCVVCGERLAGLSRLEESLGVLGRTEAPARARSGGGLALAVFVAVVGSLLILGLRAASRLARRADGPRVLSGEIAVGDRPLRFSPLGPDRVPENVPLTAAGLATVSLEGALLEAGPATTFALVGPRELRLRTGELALGVDAGTSELSILTPLGTASTVHDPHDSHPVEFAVFVQQPPTGAAAMSFSRTSQITAAAAVTVLVTSGAVLWKSVDASPFATPEVRLGAGDQAVARNGSLEISRPSALADAASAHSAAVSQLRHENDSLKAELARSQARALELEHRLAEAAPESSQSKGTPAGAPGGAAGMAAAPGAPLKGPRIAFESLRDVDALSKVDWHRAGEASKKMSELVKQMMDDMKAGQPVPPELSALVVEENTKLQKVAMTLMGKLPTWATGNGEYTHPIVLANVEAEHLVAAGLPLSDDQISSVVALGAEYDARWKAAQAGYTDQTLLLDKLLDELELKKTFCDRMDAVLTPDQQAQLFDPATRHVLGIDLYSPMLMVIQTCQPFGKPTVAELKRTIASSWAAALELDDTHKTDVELAVGSLLSQITPPTVTAAELRMVRIDEALADGRANAAALKELLRPLSGDAEAKLAIQGVGYFYVPRLIAKP